MMKKWFVLLAVLLLLSTACSKGNSDTVIEEPLAVESQDDEPLKVAVSDGDEQSSDAAADEAEVKKSSMEGTELDSEVNGGLIPRYILLDDYDMDKGLTDEQKEALGSCFGKEWFVYDYVEGIQLFPSGFPDDLSEKFGYSFTYEDLDAYNLDGTMIRYGFLGDYNGIDFLEDILFVNDYDDTYKAISSFDDDQLGTVSYTSSYKAYSQETGKRIELYYHQSTGKIGLNIRDTDAATGNQLLDLYGDIPYMDVIKDIYNDEDTADDRYQVGFKLNDTGVMYFALDKESVDDGNGGSTQICTFHPIIYDYDGFLLNHSVINDITNEVFGSDIDGLENIDQFTDRLSEATQCSPDGSVSIQYSDEISGEDRYCYIEYISDGANNEIRVQCEDQELIGFLKHYIMKNVDRAYADYEECVESFYNGNTLLTFYQLNGHYYKAKFSDDMIIIVRN